MSVCMLCIMCMFVVSIWVFSFFKASLKGILLQQKKSLSASETESTHKAEKGETFRQEVRGGFDPDSYLETPACFLFFWPVKSQSQS